MLKTKLRFLSQDKSGRFIKVQDVTGLQSQGVIDGYGDPGLGVSDISCYYVSASKIFSNAVFVHKITGNEPGKPSLAEIASGAVFELDTSMFEEQKYDGVFIPIEIFKDGVLDLNLYACFAGYEDITGTKGDNFITGSDFEDAYKADSIVINDVIYDIDKSKDNNGYTVLYLLSDLEEDATEFDILYRSNIKALLKSVGENLNAYACNFLADKHSSSLWQNVFVAKCFRDAAVSFFNQNSPDYYKANSLLVGSSNLLKEFAV